MANEIKPVISQEFIQEKVNEYAQKGVLKAIEEFYTGYNSPFVEKVREDLNQEFPNYKIDVPYFIGALNQALSAEVDKIVNTAISKTYIPLVKRMFTKTDGVVKFSEILSKFIEEKDYDDNDYSDYHVEVEQSRYVSDFLCIEINSAKRSYRFHLSKQKNGNYRTTSLPDDLNRNNPEKTMKLKIADGDSATLTMPFTPGILNDGFLSYFASIIIGDNEIVMDVEDFQQDMF